MQFQSVERRNSDDEVPKETIRVNKKDDDTKGTLEE